MGRVLDRGFMKIPPKGCGQKDLKGYLQESLLGTVAKIYMNLHKNPF